MPPTTDILGIGTAVPDRVMNNQELEELVETSDDWIVSRTGIRERRVIDDQENVSDLAARAATMAIEDSGLSPDDIDLIVVASGSPEMIWPATACLVQDKLGLRALPAFDLQAACAGFVYGLTMVDGLIRAGIYRKVLLIGAEAMTRLIDWTDRGTCILFGDGAGAVVLGLSEDNHGLLSHFLSSDGSESDILKIPAGGSGVRCGEGPQAIQMRGNEVFKLAVQKLPEAIEGALEQAGLSVADVDFCVPHQANKRIIDAAAKRLGLSREKIVGNLDRYGNTSTASIPLALQELVASGRLERGMIVVTAAVGAGFTWGANVFRWSGLLGSAPKIGKDIGRLS